MRGFNRAFLFKKGGDGCIFEEKGGLRKVLSNAG
jgi:hypothetical protein